MLAFLPTSKDLGLEVQMEALKHCDQLFIERESGSNNARPELEKALKLASDLSQDGKQVIFTIYKLDRPDSPLCSNC